MKRMRTLAVAMVTAIMIPSGIWAIGASASAAAHGRTIRVDAEASQENFVDVDPVGPSLGDQLVVHDDWKNGDGEAVGHDGLVCTVTSIDPDGSVEFECLLTGHLQAGDLTAQGAFSGPATEPPLPTATLAVTGGTGRFAEAAGTVTVQEVSEEETHLTFHLSP